MCGIAGAIDWQGRDKRSIVAAMTRSLAHRGPDGEGISVSGAATLGHRRLAVIDLSQAAAQPMFDAAGRYAIVFNGEIYNFKDVRADLEREGVVLRTQGDTEIVLEAYRRWGAAALARLDGMFAFAIWDNAAERLFLARDRFGEKPLYYTETSDGFVFASQLDALLAEPAIARRLDETALANFMAWGYASGPQAAIAGVRRLPPASHAVFDRNGFSGPSTYWSLLDHYGAADAPRALDTAAEALGAELDRASQSQLVSDVRVGAFLSGGIDSSSIVAAIARAGPTRDLDTFCIGFDVAGFSETDEARRVAVHLGTAHQDRTITAGDAADANWAAAWDEPFADTSMVATWILARFARERVTVALSGDGGDELFAGYETYAADALRRSLAIFPGAVLNGAAALVGAFAPVKRGKVTWDFKARRFFEYASGSAIDAHVDWRRIFADAEIAALLRPAWRHVLDVDARAQARAAYQEAKGLHWIDRMGYVDVRTWLPDDILVKVDRATMAHGLEARAPFLDRRLAEFAAGLAPELKMKGLARKRVLKRSQRTRLPAATIARRKAGFNAPVGAWAMGWAATLDPIGLAGDVFEPKAVAALIADHVEQRADNGHKLFALSNFALWRQRLGV
jgi:asparagine synthase (glutamine-hydrolysing)